MNMNTLIGVAIWITLLLAPGLWSDDADAATTQRPNVKCHEGRLIGTFVGRPVEGLGRDYVVASWHRTVGPLGSRYAFGRSYAGGASINDS